MKIFFYILMLTTVFVFSGSKFDEDIKISSPEKGIFVVDLNSENLNIFSYYSDSLETVESVAKKTGAKVAVNAGFFDPVNKKTISYVINNGKLIGDPTKNENLINNKVIASYLPIIFDRSELRILRSRTGKIKYDIASHSDPVENNWKIIHSIQAGPELFPELSLEKEFFVVYKNEKLIKQSAGALSKYARSAIGMKSNHLYLVVATNDKKMTLKELSDFMKKLGIEKAMAFDGGSSTSLYVDINNTKINISSGKNNESRMVKSILLIN